MLGKTYDEAVQAYHNDVESIVADFHKDYKYTTQETINDFLNEVDNEILGTGELSAYKEVSRISYSDFPENVSREERVSIIKIYQSAINLKERLKADGYSDLYPAVFQRLMEDFVQEKCFNVYLSNDQVLEMINKAKSQGRALGRSLILKKLQSQIDAINLLSYIR